MSLRVQKVQKNLRSIIASYILNMKGYFSGMVSVTNVIVTGDLRNAKIFVTILQDEKSEADIALDMETLQDEARHIQKVIAKEMPMKFCPKIKFILDPSVEKIIKIDSILHDIGKEQALKEKTKQTNEDNSSGS